MPRARFSAYKSSIINRGPQSGGSVGGNDKAGLVSFSLYSGVPVSIMLNRIHGNCCKDPVKSSENVSVPA